MWLDRGVAHAAPDVIVHPGTRRGGRARPGGRATARACRCVPWGGGSGTQGGALPIHSGIIVDLKRLDRILEIDETSLSVTRAGRHQRRRSSNGR